MGGGGMEVRKGGGGGGSEGRALTPYRLQKRRMGLMRSQRKMCNGTTQHRWPKRDHQYGAEEGEEGRSRRRERRRRRGRSLQAGRALQATITSPELDE